MEGKPQPEGVVDQLEEEKNSPISVALSSGSHFRDQIYRKNTANQMS
jgi:hypothetical protein